MKPMRALTVFGLLLAGCVASPEGPPDVTPWPDRPDAGVPSGQGVVAAPPPPSPPPSDDGSSDGCGGPYPVASMVPLGDGWAVRVHLDCPWDDQGGVLRLVSPDGSLRPPPGVSWEARVPEHGPANGTFLFPVEVHHPERGVAVAAWGSDGQPDDRNPDTAVAELGRVDGGWADVRTYALRYEGEVPWRNGTDPDMGPWIRAFSGGVPGAFSDGGGDPRDNGYDVEASGHVLARLEGDVRGRLFVAVQPLNLSSDPVVEVSVRTPEAIAYDGAEQRDDGFGNRYGLHRFHSLGRGTFEVQLEASWQNPGAEAQVRCITFRVEPADALVFYVGGTTAWSPCP